MIKLKWKNKTVEGPKPVNCDHWIKFQQAVKNSGEANRKLDESMISKMHQKPKNLNEVIDNLKIDISWAYEDDKKWNSKIAMDILLKFCKNCKDAEMKNCSLKEFALNIDKTIDEDYKKMCNPTRKDQGETKGILSLFE